MINPLPDDKILDWFKLKQSADDNFEFNVNSRKFSKLVENTVGKGEIAYYEQFLLFPRCFQKACFPRASKGVTVWEWVNVPTKLQYNSSKTVGGVCNTKFPIFCTQTDRRTDKWRGWFQYTFVL